MIARLHLPCERVRLALCKDSKLAISCRASSSRSVQGPYQQFTRWSSTNRALPTKNVIDMLDERGLLKEIAGDKDFLRTRTNEQSVKVYSGIDPTAASMHLGHLIPLNILIWFFAYGHHAVSVVGDVTATVGDPTGRTHARAESEQDVRQARYMGIKQQLASIWNNAEARLKSQKCASLEKEKNHEIDQSTNQKRMIVSNSAWLSKLTVPDFLKYVASGAAMGPLMSRDTVKTRLNSGNGMSLAEFMYPMIQSYDWFSLFVDRGVEIQVGGSDQYGNIITGKEYIQHMQTHHPERCFKESTTSGRPIGITAPLLTSSSGEKLGKSAGNAVWLDAVMLHPFEFYGSLLRTADADVENHLKLLSLASMDTIHTTLKEHSLDPSMRKAQTLLADEVCAVVHGLEWQQYIKALHYRSRNPTISGFVEISTMSGKPDGEAAMVRLSNSFLRECSPRDLLDKIDAAESRSKARSLLESGGVYIARQVNNDSDQLQFEQVKISRCGSEIRARDWLIQDKYIFMRVGKWKIYMIEMISD